MTPASESLVASRLRLEAARNPDVHLMRNNSGGFRAPDRSQPCCPTCGQHPLAPRLVRFGLGNDSSQANDTFASHDFVGIRRVLILPEHVGQTIGQFVSRETKPEGWTPAPPTSQTETAKRERAQQAWADLINHYGGDARFCTGEGTL